MTLTQLLKEAGKFYRRKDASHIGHLISQAAKEKGVRWGKVEETVIVNDYPEDFVEDMKRITADYYAKKREVEKRVLSQMKAEEKAKIKPEANQEKKIRKKIPIKK